MANASRGGVKFDAKESPHPDAHYVRRSRSVRIGVLDVKNGGRRPPMPPPPGEGWHRVRGTTMSSNFKELRLASVSRHFDNPSGQRVAALHELTLTIRRGEFICLLGPSLAEVGFTRLRSLGAEVGQGRLPAARHSASKTRVNALMARTSG